MPSTPSRAAATGARDRGGPKKSWMPGAACGAFEVFAIYVRVSVQYMCIYVTYMCIYIYIDTVHIHMCKVGFSFRVLGLFGSLEICREVGCF